MCMSHMGRSSRGRGWFIYVEIRKKDLLGGKNKVSSWSELLSTVLVTSGMLSLLSQIHWTLYALYHYKSDLSLKKQKFEKTIPTFLCLFHLVIADDVRTFLTYWTREEKWLQLQAELVNIDSADKTYMSSSIELESQKHHQIQHWCFRTFACRCTKRRIYPKKDPDHL